MECCICGDHLVHSDANWAFDEVYCYSCFDDRYNHCSSCDQVMSVDDTNYSENGDALCTDCYRNDYDELAPNNPSVTISDRNLIVKLSRNWLAGKVETKRYIRINEKDIHLKSIRKKIGLVDYPIYLFGLKNNNEYQISASENLSNLVTRSIGMNGINAKILVEKGNNRLGISLELREKHLPEILNLISQITCQSVLEPAPQ